MKIKERPASLNNIFKLIVDGKVVQEAGSYAELSIMLQKRLDTYNNLIEKYKDSKYNKRPFIGISFHKKMGDNWI